MAANYTVVEYVGVGGTNSDFQSSIGWSPPYIDFRRGSSVGSALNQRRPVEEWVNMVDFSDNTRFSGVYGCNTPGGVTYQIGYRIEHQYTFTNTITVADAGSYAAELSGIEGYESTKAVLVNSNSPTEEWDENEAQRGDYVDVQTFGAPQRFAKVLGYAIQDSTGYQLIMLDFPESSILGGASNTMTICPIRLSNKVPVRIWWKSTIYVQSGPAYAPDKVLGTVICAPLTNSAALLPDNTYTQLFPMLLLVDVSELCRAELLNVDRLIDSEYSNLDDSATRLQITCQRNANYTPKPHLMIHVIPEGYQKTNGVDDARWLIGDNIDDRGWAAVTLATTFAQKNTYRFTAPNGLTKTIEADKGYIPFINGYSKSLIQHPPFGEDFEYNVDEFTTYALSPLNNVVEFRQTIDGTGGASVPYVGQTFVLGYDLYDMETEEDTLTDIEAIPLMSLATAVVNEETTVNLSYDVVRYNRNNIMVLWLNKYGAFSYWVFTEYDPYEYEPILSEKFNSAGGLGNYGAMLGSGASSKNKITVHSPRLPIKFLPMMVDLAESPWVVVKPYFDDFTGEEAPESAFTLGERAAQVFSIKRAEGLSVSRQTPVFDCLFELEQAIPNPKLIR